jgi:hypothetical protein
MYMELIGWGVVRRIINNKVYFLYADDLNNTRTEQEIKHLLQTYSPPEFHSTTPIWMQCRSITYQPHSNECGPRTLFALTALALHPDSTPDLLLSFMHPNLAQILRTWVAATIVTGQCFLPTWQSTYPSSTPRATSVPAYLFPWKSSNSSSTTHDHKHKTKRRTK